MSGQDLDKCPFSPHMKHWANGKEPENKGIINSGLKYIVYRITQNIKVLNFYFKKKDIGEL